MTLRHLLILSAIFMLPCGAYADTAAGSGLWSKLYEPGHFAIMRHATAPGTGDPDNFTVGDCSTQRNLNDTGREEATAIGASARAAGLTSALVYSSQWCRCLDTARLLELGDVRELPALNSFYQRYHERDGNMRALRTFIENNAGVAEPIVLVTHQVTISALTDTYTRQGETIVFRHTGDGKIEVVGSIPPG